jgi:quinohemoprotein ethanol dehydrogenase
MQLGMRSTRAPETFPGVSAVPEFSGDPHDGKGALIAWDPVTQTKRWEVWHKWLWNGGTLSTAGNLVFQGTADGWLTAYDATDGKVVWRFNAGLGIIAPPISYSWHGTQYVSILVGWGGSNFYAMNIMPSGWRYNAQPRRLLTFKLGGTARLAPTAPYDETVHPLDDPSVKLIPADVAAGRALFNTTCNSCHGKDAESAGAPGPDLRESAIAMDRTALWSVLHEGALLPKGMPRFASLTEEQVGQLYQFIRDRARAASGKGNHAE